MNEAGLTRDITAALKDKLPGAVIFKLHDVSTQGIPDLAVTWCGRTAWIEVKLLERHETPSTLRGHFPKLQLTLARLLARKGHCLYLIGKKSTSGPPMLAIRKPLDIWKCLYGKESRSGGNDYAIFQAGSFIPLYMAIAEAVKELFYKETR